MCASTCTVHVGQAEKSLSKTLSSRLAAPVIPLAPSAPQTFKSGRTLLTITVSDEGDDSRRMARSTAQPDVYLGLMASQVQWISVSAAPLLDDDFETVCPSTATDWGVIRMVTAADVTGGGYTGLTGTDCEPRSIANAVAASLQSMLDSRAP